MFSKSLIVSFLVIITSSAAFAQPNVLTNGDFETNPPTKPCNNPGYSIAPWIVAAGNTPNVVKVDGPGGAIDCGFWGAESDASGQSGTRHYLDVIGPSLDFYQSFTPQCSGSVDFGGYFSTRDNLRATGSIALREGTGASGPPVGSTTPVDLAPGISKTDPWTQVTATAPVTGGSTYSFVVTMDQNMSFDEAFVRYRVSCDTIRPDPCCPPWDSQMLEDMLFYEGSGGIADPYTLKFKPSTTLQKQMQAYIDYLHALNPAMAAITIHFRINDAGTGAAPTGGPQVGLDHWSTWMSPGNGNPIPPVNFFSLGNESLQVNRWYRVHTGIYLEGGQSFFGAQCANNNVDVRIQVQNQSLMSAGQVMEIRHMDGRTVEKRIQAQH